MCTIIGGAISPQPNGVRRPAVAQIAATIMDRHTQPSPTSQTAAGAQTNPSPATDSNLLSIVNVTGAADDTLRPQTPGTDDSTARGHSTDVLEGLAVLGAAVATLSPESGSANIPSQNRDFPSMQPASLNRFTNLDYSKFDQGYDSE